MNVMRPADVIARVVAWHNRHPLARRIGRDQVTGIGVVVLPFGLKGSGDPTDAPASLTPLFGHDWMFHAAEPRLGTWSQRHGVYPLPGFDHWPLRQIDADLALSHAADARGLSCRTARHLLTAVVDAAGQRTRVLLSPRGDPRSAPVFGQRLFSLPRLSGATGLAGAGAALSMGLSVWLMWSSTAPPLQASPPMLAASAPAPTAVAEAGPAAVPEPPALPPTDPPSLAAEPAHAPDATVVADATAGSEPAERPVDTDPVVLPRGDGVAPLVSIRPRLSAEDRESARQLARKLRPAPAMPLADGPAFAIATPPARSRDDALAQRALLQGLQAQTVTAAPTRLDLMSARGRWRVVWWPHPREPEAQALVREARARGLVVELISF